MMAARNWAANQPQLVNHAVHASIAVPYNWSRELIDGRVVYVNRRTNDALQNYHEVGATLTVRCLLVSLTLSGVVNRLFADFPRTNQVRAYLSKEGTCKCGLECPLIVENVFNFDPHVASRHVNHIANCDPNEPSGTLCNHKRKISAIAAFDHHVKAQPQSQTHSYHHQVQPPPPPPPHPYAASHNYVHQAVHEVTRIWQNGRA